MQIHSAKLVAITPKAEELIAYCARVSSPHQKNEKIKGLLKYCFKHKHFSIFEMANMCVEITTTRAIETQIIRHRSFSYQSLSMRYAAVGQESDNPLPSLLSSINDIEWRKQDNKNRQNSFELSESELSELTQLNTRAVDSLKVIQDLYEDLLEAGVAKECARNILPLCTPTRLYMNGSIRSWIHYLQVRTDPSTQKEHRLVANSIKDIFTQELPIISELLNEI